MLLDADGHRIAGIADRADRADLPLVAGDGADAAVVEARAVLQAASPLGARIRGLVRVSERRWDLVLDRDQRIFLPADGPVAAVERLIALDQAEHILARDIVSVDLRNPLRPVLRLTPQALLALRQSQGLKIPSESKT
jgi:cell division protein FtsQ